MVWSRDQRHPYEMGAQTGELQLRHKPVSRTNSALVHILQGQLSLSAVPLCKTNRLQSGSAEQGPERRMQRKGSSNSQVRAAEFHCTQGKPHPQLRAVRISQTSSHEAQQSTMNT